ncbi:F-box protein At2g39490 [Euphorbia lathyris]|uniref:F-box protein At2g39490 n=1 Tax=Euphorbia lathyris TaxID=212925 RepID=UPI003313F243
MDAYDRISSLPDEILFHIISSLPFESSIQTIFLSKRWKFLWDTALVHHGTSHHFATEFSSFLANFNDQNPSKNTRKFKFHFTNNGSFLLAIIAPNHKLLLNFSSPPNHTTNQLFNLQLEFNPDNRLGTDSTGTRQDFSTRWSSENAEKLYESYVQSHNFLCKSALNTPVSESWIRPSSFFIKTLHLTSLSCLTNEAASSILTTFQFLETLKISNCNCLRSLFIGSDTKLQSLTIFDCLKLEFVHIRCFKLHTFRYRGICPSFWPEYHYNLVDALLDFRLGPVDNRLMVSRCNFDLMLLTIKNVRVLTLCKWTFQALICRSLSRINAEFQFYNLKELWWIDNNSDDEYDSDALFCFLKLCPFLEQLFVTIDPKSYCVEKARVSSCCCIEAGRNTKLGNLKMVKLDGFRNQKHEIHLAQGLVEIVTTEPIIFASANGVCLKKIPNSHQTNYFYTHVSLKDAKESYSTKHLHMAL